MRGIIDKYPYIIGLSKDNEIGDLGLNKVIDKRTANGEENALVVLSIEELKRFNTDFGVDLEYATTIFALTHNLKLCRFDSKIIEEKNKASCKKLRHYSNKSVCNKSDIDHSSCFFGMDKKHFANMLRDKSYKVTYGVPPDCRIKHIYLQSRNRYYIEYSCPYLSHTEWMFPIFVNDIVVSIMFIGQIEEQYDKKKIEESLLGVIDRTPDFFINENNENLLKKCKHNINKFNQTIIQEITHADEKESIFGTQTLNLEEIAKVLFDYEDSLQIKYIEIERSGISEYTNKKKNIVFDKLGEIYIGSDYKKNLSYFWKLSNKKRKTYLMKFKLVMLRHMQIINILSIMTLILLDYQYYFQRLRNHKLKSLRSIKEMRY